jgi:hypothetical protein
VQQLVRRRLHVGGERWLRAVSVTERRGDQPARTPRGDQEIRKVLAATRWRGDFCARRLDSGGGQQGVTGENQPDLTLWDSIACIAGSGGDG